MENELKLISDTMLIAGKIMMESGSEAYRVEDTMQRIAKKSTHIITESYVTATAIFIVFNDYAKTNFIQFHNRMIDLEKIDLTNLVCRKYANNEMSLAELNGKLKIINKEKCEFNLYYRMFATGIASASLMILFGGKYKDILPAFIIGIIGNIVSNLIIKKTKIKYISNAIAVFFIGTSCLILKKIGMIIDLDKLIIGGLMPLVPGLAITAGFRDLFEGHLLTGILKIVDAVLDAMIIGIVIGIILTWLN